MDATAPDTSLILAFVAVAEELSFSRAAVRTRVTKGTISRKIARLEALVGVELVRRNTHRVTLTSAGRELLERARAPVRALAAITTDLPAEDAPLAGEIVLTAPLSVGIELLPAVLEQFSALHPGVTFDIRLTNEPLDLVGTGVDIALRVSPNPLPDSSLVARRVGHASMAFYASPSYLARKGHPRAFGDPKHEWLLFAPGSVSAGPVVRGELKRLGAPKGFVPKLRTDDPTFLRELIRRGAGVGFLPTFLADSSVGAGTLVRVLTTAQFVRRGGLFVIVPSQRKIPRRVEAFRAHLLRSLRLTSR